MFPLVAIATSILPDLIGLIANDKAGKLATDVANAVKTATGTSDPATAKQKIASDPAAASNLQVQLAQIALDAGKAQNAEADQQRQDEITELKEMLADAQSARTNLLSLASNRSAIAWVAPAVSFLVMIGFYVLLGILIKYFNNDDLAKNQLLNICIGALVAAFSTVVNFWLGSSKSSQDKDQVQAAQTTQVLQTAEQQTKAALNTADSATAKATTAATTAVTTTAAAAASVAGAQTAPVSRGTVPAASDDATNFNQCMAVVFTEEGGYTVDDGGPTNYGIVIPDLEEFTGKKNLTADDIKALTKATAQEIYRQQYWNPMQCGEMPNGVDLEVFDFGVNAGIGTSIRTLQAALGVTVDGSVGPITLAAAKVASVTNVIQSFSERRMNYYRSLGQEWATYGAGWTNRTNSVEQAALKMAAAASKVAAG